MKEETRAVCAGLFYVRLYAFRPGDTWILMLYRLQRVILSEGSQARQNSSGWLFSQSTSPEGLATPQALGSSDDSCKTNNQRVISEQARKLAKTPQCGVFAVEPDPREGKA